jgi:predicted nucleic acid-binding protein
LENLGGKRPLGYRAPAFSITRETTWAYDVLADLGFRYDSSQYDSPRIRERIGDVPHTPYRLALSEGREIWEYPITVWPVRGRSVPMGGGAYWRALPTAVLRRALREVVAENSHPVLYFHPYELDPQPLRATLPESPTPKQRALAAWKSVQRNPGRRLVADRIRAIAREHKLVAPTLVSSQALSALYQAAHRGEMSVEQGIERVTRINSLKVRFLGDKVLQRKAWKVADQLGWETTFDAEFVALTQLQADAFVTSDGDLARAVSGLVETATIDALRTA